jgi:hypothetical protein
MPDPPPVDDLDDDDAFTPRPRRRLATPVTAGLAGLALATAGFIGGVQVQKGQAGATTATPNLRAAGLGGAPGGGGGAPAAGQDAPTVGTVANKKGTTLYVTGADGTTVRVKTNAQSKVTRNAATSPRGIFPGDTVVVQGAKGADGNLVATQITATSKTAAASGAGFARGGFGRRFGGAGAGAAPGGATPAGG